MRLPCGSLELLFGVFVAFFFTLLNGLEAFLAALGAIGSALHQLRTNQF